MAASPEGPSAVHAWPGPPRRGRGPFGALALALALFALLGAGAALAHARGYHKRIRGTVSTVGVELLVTVDLDGGKQAQELRRRADADLDGLLTEGERAVLKERLVQQLLRPLAVHVGGQPLNLEVLESKLSLRDDARVAEVGVSAAALVRAPFPGTLTPGMKLVLKDESPDRSHVLVELQPQLLGDGGVSGELERAELRAGDRFQMTLRP